MLSELSARLPAKFERYHEPFIGGGALFFALQPERASISDINPDLINVYRVIQNDVDALIQDLKKHPHDKEYFYKLRNADRTPGFQRWSSVRRASRTIYLNKTCFNGLYRVNSRGQFNVPFGSYKNPTIADETNLLACHAALRSTAIAVAPFDEALESAGQGDFIYFDPPYAPLSATSSFTNYSKDGFGTEEQERLRDLCGALDKRGVRFMLSNSSAPLVLDLYQDFHVELVAANRAINSNARRRGKIQEAIVRNYES